MPRRSKNNDIRLSVLGDLDGMTVGRLREILDGVSDDTPIEIDEEEWPDYLSSGDDGRCHVDTSYHIMIRND